MKYTVALAVLLSAFVVGSANAEDRLTATYTQKAVAELSDTWSVGVEKDFGKLGNVTVVGEAGYTNVLDVNAQDAVWTAGLSGEVPLSDKVHLEVGVARLFVSDTNNDLDQVRAGVVYKGDAWRLSGAVVKQEGVDAFAEATVERKILGDLAVGVGTRFDASEYFATTVFAAYSF